MTFESKGMEGHMNVAVFQIEKGQNDLSSLVRQLWKEKGAQKGIVEEDIIEMETPTGKYSLKQGKDGVFQLETDKYATFLVRVVENQLWVPSGHGLAKYIEFWFRDKKVGYDLGRKEMQRDYFENKDQIPDFPVNMDEIREVSYRPR